MLRPLVTAALTTLLLLSLLALPGRVAAQTPSAITLDKTVGTDPLTCSISDTLRVPMGTLVTYCYTLSNNDKLTYTFHTLVDDAEGRLLDNKFLLLGPGMSDTVTSTALITGPVIASATWIATATTGITMSASDVTTVTIGSPTAVALQGFDATTARNGVALLAAALAALIGGWWFYKGNNTSTAD